MPRHHVDTGGEKYCFDVNMTLCKIIVVTLRIIGIVSGIIGNLKGIKNTLLGGV